MLLIFPPVAKPCEPPAGITKLAGALKSRGISCAILDANLEGLLHILQQSPVAIDTWTRRAVKNISTNLTALRDARIYRSLERYGRALRDVQRVLEVSAREKRTILGLADYHHQHRSPVRSADLLASAGHPEQNPFYPYFSKRLPELLENNFSLQRREGCAGKREDCVYDESGRARIIGFSLNYLSQALTTFSMIGYLRKEFPGVKIALGGGLVSSWMKRPDWKNPFGSLVDHLISGPGEGPLLALLGAQPVNQEQVQPDYSSLSLRNYLSPGFVLPYSGSSGCYWNKCSFCPEAAEDNPYIPVPTAQAMADLKALVEKTKPVLIHLLDNSISPALLRALAHDPINVPWYGFARISQELTDPDFCLALKRSGCTMLKLGLESGDQDMLDRMEKGVELSTASRVLQNLKQTGIAAYVYLLFGTPAETLPAARRTLDFVVNHADAITFLNLAIINMPLCSRETDRYETEQFYEGDLSLYTSFRHPRGWDRKAVRQFLDNEFKRHPSVSAILKNDPPIFTSNHAAFFVKP